MAGVRGTLAAFLEAAGCCGGAGGESERENETPPVLEHVAVGSRSLEKREGGVAAEADCWGMAKEWLWGVEAEEDEGWGALPLDELWRCASSMAVLTSGWLAWYFSRWRARER